MKKKIIIIPKWMEKDFKKAMPPLIVKNREKIPPMKGVPGKITNKLSELTEVNEIK